MMAVGGPGALETVELPEPETFALERAADAHRALEAGHVVGKAVLTMD
jgi:hypothetical protein